MMALLKQVFFYQIGKYMSPRLYANHVMKPTSRPPSKKKRPETKRHSRAKGSLSLLIITLMTYEASNAADLTTLTHCH